MDKANNKSKKSYNKELKFGGNLGRKEMIMLESDRSNNSAKRKDETNEPTESLKTSVYSSDLDSFSSIS